MNKKTNNKIKSANSLLKIMKPEESSKKDIKELLEKLEDLNIISSLNNAINEGESLKEIIKMFSNQTKKLFAGLGATVYLLSEDSKYLIMQNSTLPPGIVKKVDNIIRIKIPEVKISLKKESAYSRALEQAKPQIINDPEGIQKLIYDFSQAVKLKNKVLHKAFKKITPKIYKILNINSVLIVPLISNDKAIGVIDISREKPFRSVDLKRFKTISSIIITAINKKIAEDQLKSSTLESNMILETGINGMRVIDKDFNVLRVNKQFCKISGLSKSKNLAQKCYESFPGEHCNKPTCTVKILQSGLNYAEREAEKVRTDGKVVPCLITALPLMDADRKVVGMVENYKDITEKKKAEEKLQHLNIILQTIRNVNELIIREKDKGKLIKSICKTFTEGRGHHSAWIALVDDKGKLTEAVESGVGKDFRVLIERINKGKHTTCWEKTMSSSGIIINKDPKKDCRDCPLAEYYGGRGAMTARLTHDKKIYGILSASTPLEYIEGKEDKNLFAEITGDISFALYSLELEEKRKEAEKTIKIERDRLISILDSMADGVYIVDKNYVIEYINPVLRKEFGPVGKRKCYEYFHGLKKPCPWCKNEKVFKGKTVRWEWYSKKNKKSYDLMDTPLKNIDGTMSKLEIFRDITDIKKSEEELKKSYINLQKTLNDVIDTLASIVETKDPYTSGHQKRVAALAVSISKELGLEKDKIKAIGTAAMIHDIGKINIPASILARPGKISPIEFDMIKTHPQVGYEMIKRIEFPWPIADIILQHHERLDGSGYPNGLKGKDIVLEARIIAVADVVEAMSSHRPYRPALGIKQALKEIKKGKGKLYDAEVVEACVKVITKKRFKF